MFYEHCREVRAFANVRVRTERTLCPLRYPMGVISSLIWYVSLPSFKSSVGYENSINCNHSTATPSPNLKTSPPMAKKAKMMTGKELVSQKVWRVGEMEYRSRERMIKGMREVEGCERALERPS